MLEVPVTCWFFFKVSRYLIAVNSVIIIEVLSRMR